MKIRTERLAAVCGQKDFYRTEFQKRTEKAITCYGDELCNRYAMGSMMLPINNDFTRLIHWEAIGSPPPAPTSDVCSALPELIRIAFEDQQKEEIQTEQRQAEVNLLRCAKSQATRLDDRVSDAKLIAESSVNSCSSEINKLAAVFLKSKPIRDWRASVASAQSELIPFVLENRAKSRKR